MKRWMAWSCRDCTESVGECGPRPGPPACPTPWGRFRTREGWGGVTCGAQPVWLFGVALCWVLLCELFSCTRESCQCVHTHTCSPPCSSFRQELPPSLYPSIHLSVCPSAAWLQPEFASPSLSNSSSHQDLSHDPLHACSQEEWGWRDLTPSAPWERLFWTPGFQAATSTWLSCPRVQGAACTWPQIGSCCPKEAFSLPSSLLRPFVLLA